MEGLRRQFHQKMTLRGPGRPPVTHRRKRRFARRTLPMASNKGNYSKSQLIHLQMNQVAPDSVMVKFSYHRVFNITIANPKNFISFRGNGPFDPEVALGGGSCMGFIQWLGVQALYRRYRVLASKCEVKITTDNNTPTSIFLFPSRISSTPGTYPNAAGVPYQRHLTIGDQDGSQSGSLSSYMTTSKINGISKNNVLSEFDYSGPYNNVPTNEWFWNIYANTLDDSTSIGNLFLELRITYYTKLEERNQPGVA